jgi:hypothetical protein
MPLEDKLKRESMIESKNWIPDPRFHGGFGNDRKGIIHQTHPPTPLHIPPIYYNISYFRIEIIRLNPLLTYDITTYEE